MNISLNISKIIKFLSFIAILLIVANTIMLTLYFTINDASKFDFIQLVDLGQEANLPTLFSSIILMISAFLFYLLANVEKEQQQGNKPYWLGLSFIFAFLSFDEGATIHEMIGDFTETFVGHSGVLFYPWVISYSILVVILGFFYFRFFKRMESKVFWAFVGAAVLFLTGALGIELLEAKEESIHNADTLLYCTYFTIEESLEMFGVIYLIHTLLNLLKDQTLKLEN